MVMKLDDEVINKIIPEPEVQHVKQPRYISKNIHKIRLETKEGKFAHRTFGVPQVTLKKPSEYLRKKTHIQYRKSDVKHVHIRRPNYQHKLPSWTPAKKVCHEDKIPQKGTNFKKQNIINAKKSQPPEPKKRYVDTRFGTVHELEPSGLYPIYIYRKSYGKLPKIIRMERNAVTKESDEKTDDSRDQDKDMKNCISEEERKILLDGMKKRWDEMMKQFQCLPFIIDSEPKAQRKTKLEHELQQLEKDIAIIEKHSYICIYDNEN